MGYTYTYSQQGSKSLTQCCHRVGGPTASLPLTTFTFITNVSFITSSPATGMGHKDKYAHGRERDIHACTDLLQCVRLRGSDEVPRTSRNCQMETGRCQLHGNLRESLVFSGCLHSQRPCLHAALSSETIRGQHTSLVPTSLGPSMFTIGLCHSKNSEMTLARALHRDAKAGGRRETASRSHRHVHQSWHRTQLS
jgi:hypothetical protein